MEHPNHDSEFACEDCDFTSPLSNDTCPNCGGRMNALDAPIKLKTTTEEADADGVDEPEAGAEEGGALSLESLQEQESKEDSQDDYGDGNE